MRMYMIIDAGKRLHEYIFHGKQFKWFAWKENIKKRLLVHDQTL